MSDRESPAASAADRRVAAALLDARRELIDLSRRNRLLHATRSGRRPHCLEIVEADPDALFVAVNRESKQFGFAALANPETDDGVPGMPWSSGDAEHSGRSPESDRRGDAAKKPWPARHALLQTKLATEPLARRLFKLFREARTYEEEQGVNILYLAIGFLHWFEDSRSQERWSAPLLLVPVALERRQGRDIFVLRGRDDDLMPNVSLAEKLRTEFGIVLPEPPAGDEWRPGAYLDEIATAVAGRKGWEVEPAGMGLGFFTFSKFLMWRDLDAGVWPDGKGLLAHKLIARLLGEDPPGEPEPPLAGDDQPIDPYIDLAAAVHVVDADSSQALCIEEARQGRNLVVQGPPGTGKSQTIANIIAAAANDGKSVLFVAEKAAALEVVHSRLKAVGLEPLCIELHSRKATKLTVLASLGRAIHAGGATPSDGRTVVDLRAARDRLNRWSATLHREIRRSGRTPFQVIGMALKRRGEGTRILEQRLLTAVDWDRDRLREAERAIEGAAAAVTKLGMAPVRHPWHATFADPLTPFDAARLGTALRDAAARVQQLISVSGESAALLGIERNASCAALRDEVQALRLLAQAPEEGREALSHAAWRDNRKNIAELLEEGRRWMSADADLSARVVEGALDRDITLIRQTIAAQGRSVFRWFAARYRTAVADLRGICRARPPRRLKDRLSLLDDLLTAQAARQWIEDQSAFGESVLGSLWAGTDTRWVAADALLRWAEAVASECRLPDITPLAATIELSACAGLADRLEQAIGIFETAFAKVSEAVRPDCGIVFGVAEIAKASLPVIGEKLDIWSASLDEINPWVEARIALDGLRQWGFSGLGDGLEDGGITPAEARPIADLQIAEALWRGASDDDPDLPRLDGAAREATATEFRALDCRRIELARSEVLASYFLRKPVGASGEMAVVRAEIGKKRGHLALRRLMENAAAAVQGLKPIFLMSPLSVAQFLPPGRLSFDLAVIDEASQVPPEEALGAIARCRQMIVVGDHRQLPPTNFFKMAAADDDDDDDDDIGTPARAAMFESILTLARARGDAERMLRWHYRSRHPSLIAVSNRLCYEGELLLPPSPLAAGDRLGLSLVKTPRGHYDRGGSGRNPVEAELIAAAVERHLAERPEESLGVACFSIAQRDAVDDALQARGVLAAAEAFAPKGERLFVKNLEAVQGDERDIIFVSIGYGPDAQGRMTAGFGPVSQDGGERRLNVLISRARRQCVVFSSIAAGDIPADARPRGTRMLREFLHFAETGHLAAGEANRADYESPFEEAVALAVRRRGYEVVPQVGVSGFRIDLGVLDPRQPGRFVLGIECDGAAYHSGRSARDRDRLRQQVLEGLGWKLYRIWSTDWFHAPQREGERLIAAIERACATAAVGDPPAPEPAPEEPPVASVAFPPHSTGLESYRECRLSVPPGADLLQRGRQEIADLVAKIVAAEGPVHIEEVARRLRQAFGLDRTGRRILGAVEAALDYARRQQRVSRDGSFWSACGETSPRAPRCRRDASPPLRRADRIAPAEFQAAIAVVLRECAGATRDELTVAVARGLGFDRTGSDLDRAIAAAIDAMIKSGAIEVAGDKLRPGAARA